MAENKTKATDSSVADYLAEIDDEARRKDCEALAELMAKATKQPPRMWGASIVGFAQSAAPLFRHLVVRVGVGRGVAHRSALPGMRGTFIPGVDRECWRRSAVGRFGPPGGHAAVMARSR